jgi:hypothetical protein
MPIVHGHVKAEPELAQYATCVECHRSYRPRSEDQACMELCDECFETAKYPREHIVSVHVRPKPEHHKPDIVL